MIDRIEIYNFALIVEAKIDCVAGLTIFSGETGAGKSLLIAALDLISGGRASRDMLRQGADNCRIEAVFSYTRDLLPHDLKERLLEDRLLERDESGAFPDSLILTREIQSKGKSFCRLNGRLIPLQLLHELGTYLIDIQSQRDQAALFDPKRHLSFLDRFGGEELAGRLALYQATLSEWKEAEKQRRTLGGEPALRARELDLLKWQMAEIDSLSPRPGEDEKLRSHQQLYRNAGKINQLIQQALNILSDDADDALPAVLGLAGSALQSASALDPSYEDFHLRLSTVVEELLDLRRELSDKFSGQEYRPDILGKIEERLHKLSALKQKYGPDLEDVFRFRERAAAREEEIRRAETLLEELDGRLQQLRKKLTEEAEQLSVLRREKALLLEERIANELRDLGMSDTRFQVAFDEADRRFTAEGRDKVSFLIQPNPGEDLKALAKIASGGESSRIILSIKVILTSGHPNATLVFDEVDTGIGGQTCTLVGEKLKRLALENQVFCVTHAAQIAAMADEHILIEKQVSDQRTVSRMTHLDEAKRRQELARLLAGDLDDAAVDQVVAGLMGQGG